jgi:hypothetical protein
MCGVGAVLRRAPFPKLAPAYLYHHGQSSYDDHGHRTLFITANHADGTELKVESDRFATGIHCSAADNHLSFNLVA